MSVREAIQTTSTFLSASVETESGLPLIERLHQKISSSWTPPPAAVSRQAQVILYAVDLLKAISIAVRNEQSQLGIKDWRQVNALTEIILVLGLYKALTPGVGIPESRRVKSVLLGSETQREVLSLEERELLLQSIILELKETIEAKGEFGDTFRRKYLTDLISGMLNLAFDPTFPEAGRSKWKPVYEDLLSRYKGFRTY
jgi:hypothetical protein